jgi:hypothetical protein
LTYSNLKLDVYILVGVIAIAIAAMCLGAYQEAVQQASLFLALTPQQESTMMQVVNLINQYGLGVLIAICYFSNVSGGGKRRELLMDALCIAVGVLLPQLVFHISWLYTAHSIINTYNLTISAAAVNVISLEWLTVCALAIVSGLVALQARRLKTPKPSSTRKH